MPLRPAPPGVRYVDNVFSGVKLVTDITWDTALRSTRPTAAAGTLKLDMYTPSGDTDKERPAIVWVHGGGFCCGDKTSPELVDEANQFAMKGYVNVSINYRLAPNRVASVPWAPTASSESSKPSRTRRPRCASSAKARSSASTDTHRDRWLVGRRDHGGQRRLQRR